MPAPLSQDLRSRIVRAVDNGSSIRQAALRFDVGPSAAVKLVQRTRATGGAVPARFCGHRRPILDAHTALVRSFLDAEPDITLIEMQAEPARRGAASWYGRLRRSTAGSHGPA